MKMIGDRLKKKKFTDPETFFKELHQIYVDSKNSVKYHILLNLL